MTHGKAHTHTIEKTITCINKFECSDNLRDHLEKEFNCKLAASTPSDTVHGAIRILHNQPPKKHIINIDFYTENEKPDGTEHESTLKKLTTIPTLKKCEDCLNE